jgi:hypothetical protein
MVDLENTLVDLSVEMNFEVFIAYVHSLLNCNNGNITCD